MAENPDGSKPNLMVRDIMVDLCNAMGLERVSHLTIKYDFDGILEVTARCYVLDEQMEHFHEKIVSGELTLSARVEVNVDDV